MNPAEQDDGMGRGRAGTSRWIMIACLAMLFGACNPAPATPTLLPARPTSEAPPSPVPTEPPTPLPHPTERPLIWFGPLPPTLPTGAGRSFTGSVDYMQLFEADAPWPKASERVHVFLLYAEWVGGNYATDGELNQIVSDLNRRGIALAIEGSPIERPGNCGAGVESWGGIPEGMHVARRIQRAGGTIHYWAMDAPYEYTSLLDDPGACQWPAERVAGEIGEFTAALRGVYADIVVGDTEPLRRDRDNVGLYADWLRTYRQVTGENLPFFHLDSDFGIAGWTEQAKRLEETVRAEGVEFGIFYLGDWGDPSERSWLTAAGERVKSFELQAGGRPDHVMFQSWHDYPDHVLPEDRPYSYTHFINTYFDDRAALGVQTQGPGANLAYGKSVSASATFPGLPPEQAIDGIFSSWWGAGAPPPQWIEIDLGEPTSIAQIRLSISQDPVGETLHRIWGRGPGEDYRLLHEFAGFTEGDQILEAVPDTAWQGVQFVKIETLESPSWVSWREIEIISAKP